MRWTLLVYALVYSGFCFLLDAGGHRPSFGALIERHYLLQAVLIPPAVLVTWLVNATVANAIGGGDRRATLDALAPAIALPMLVLFVLPDLIVYLTLGFEALGKAARVIGPLALIGRLGAGTYVLRRTHAIGSGRAVIATLGGLIAEAAIMAPWLR